MLLVWSCFSVHKRRQNLNNTSIIRIKQRKGECRDISGIWEMELKIQFS